MLMFAFVHFNAIMFNRKRNAGINARLAKYAKAEGMREPRRLVALQNFLDHLTPKSPQKPTMHGNPKRLEFKAVQQELFDCDVKNVDKAFRKVKAYITNKYHRYPEWAHENKRKSKEGRARFEFGGEKPTDWIVVLKPGVDDNMGSEGGIVCRNFREVRKAFEKISRKQEEHKKAAVERIMKNAEKMFTKLDTDKSGTLDKGEIMAGHKLLRITALQASKLFDDLDVDGDGELTKDEMIEGYLKHPDGFASNKEMADIRQRANQVMVQEYLDGDNFEAKMPYKLRNSLASRQFVESCEIWFDDLDEDGNGVLDQDELMPILDLLYNYVLDEMNRDLEKHSVKVRFELAYFFYFSIK